MLTKTKSYHQTQNCLSSSEVADYTAAAERQESIVLRFFQQNAGLSFSPETINARVLPQAPITSVRRAITNLTRDGWLEKSGFELGNHGRKVGTWKLVIKGQMELF